MKTKIYNISLWLAIIILLIPFLFHPSYPSTKFNQMMYSQELFFYWSGVIISCLSLFLLKYWPRWQAVFQIYASLSIFLLVYHYFAGFFYQSFHALFNTIMITLAGALFIEFYMLLTLEQFQGLIKLGGSS